MMLPTVPAPAPNIYYRICFSGEWRLDERLEVERAVFERESFRHKEAPNLRVRWICYGGSAPGVEEPYAAISSAAKTRHPVTARSAEELAEKIRSEVLLGERVEEVLLRDLPLRVEEEFVYFYGFWDEREQAILMVAVQEAERQWGHRLPGRKHVRPWVVTSEEYQSEKRVYAAHRRGWTKVAAAPDVEGLAKKIVAQGSWKDG